MTKKEVWEKAKEYYQTVINTKNNYKQENKKTSKHGLYKYINSTALLALVNFSTIGVVSAVSMLAFKMNISLAVFAGILSGGFLSIVLPAIMKPVALKSKKRKFSGFAKMELDSFFEIMEQYFKSNYKNLLNAKSEDEVDKEDLEAFVKQTKIYADNYKSALQKYVFDKINKINENDYKDIKKLYQNRSKFSQDMFDKKVNKIIAKNNKNVAPWCEVGNICGKVCKNLYIRTNQMNSNISVPDDEEFVVDPCLLNKLVFKELGVSTDATLTCKKLSTFDMDMDSEQKIAKTSFHNLSEREKLNKSIFER